MQKLNEDFQEIADWAYILNMQFNRDINKQPQGQYFLENKKKKYTLKIVFNNSPVVRSNFQKHQEVYLDTKLDFTHDVKE